MSRDAKHSGGKKVTYLSPGIQNEIIECCGSAIREQVLSEVSDAKFYTVLADEAADSANWEQLPLVLRFVDSESEIRLELVDFVRCESTTGQAISQMILGKLREFALRPEERLQGQGYDGAGNMAGSMRGCPARITEECPKALYMHCSSHCLNLCVVALSNITLVHNMWAELKALNLFYKYSPKRALSLETTIRQSETRATVARTKKLVDLCKTRWVARHSALVTFADLFEPLVTNLELILENDGGHWNAESTSQATSRLTSIRSFSFIATFVLTAKVLGYIQPLTVSLQEKSLDICRAYEQVARVQATLQAIRDDVDRVHNSWWDSVTAMAEKADTEETLPPFCRQQRAGRGDVPAQTPSEFFKRAVTIPLLDEVLGHMGNRFGPLQQRAAKGLALLPRVFVQDPAKAKDCVREFAEEYQEDLPAGYNLESLSAELQLWETFLVDVEPRGALPATPAEALKAASTMLLPCKQNTVCIVCIVDVIVIMMFSETPKSGICFTRRRVGAL